MSPIEWERVSLRKAKVRSSPKNLVSRSVKDLGFLPYMDAIKLACHSFVDAGGRQETPR